MKITLLPKTRFGKWSLGLIIAFFLLFQSRQLVKIHYYGTGGKTFFSNMPLALLMIGAWLAGSLSFFTGIVSFFKKERSVVVLVCVLFGLFIFTFGVGEVLFPH